MSEAQRIKILRRYEILDTPPEELFDRVARLASRQFEAPMALVTFIDETRQWFKASIGFDVRETLREVAFCNYTIRSDKPMVVRDSLEDERFCDNPLVTCPPSIRFYAAAPLITSEGWRIGTVAILDRKPRPDFRDDDCWVLQDLAAMVVHELEIRLAASDVRSDIENRVQAENRFRMVIQHSPVVLSTQDRDLRYLWAVNLTPPYRPEDLIGKTDAELWPSPLAEQVTGVKLQAMNEHRVIRTDVSLEIEGRLHFFDLTVEPMFEDDEVAGVSCVAIDVTERKEAELALSRAEARHRAVLDTAVDAMIVIDEQGTLLHFNPAAERIFGYSTAEAIGQSVSILMPEPDRQHHKDYIGNYLRTGVAKIIGHPGRQLFGRRKDGSLVPVELAIAEWSDAGKRFFTGIIRDITRRRATETALQQAEAERLASLAMLDTIISTIPDPLFAKDLSGHYIVANPATAEAFGQSEVIGKTDFELLPEEHAAFLRAADQQVLTTGESLLFEEDVPVKESGKIHQFQSQKTPLRDAEGKIIGIVGVARDITELKAAKAEAERVGMQFRTLADSIPQLAWMAQPDGRIFWFNQRWFQFTGTYLEQMQGWGWRAIFHPDHRDRVIERFRHSLETGEPWEDVFPMRRADGEYRWFLSRALPVRDKSGAITMWFGTNTDVTEQREVEAAMAHAKEEADRANRAKSLFLATASHDLRQPVQAISLFSTALATKLHGHPAAPIADKIQASLAGLKLLLDGLLDVSRLDAGVVVPAMETFKLRPLFDRLIGDYAPIAAERDLRLKLFDPGLSAHSDPVLFERIMRNLVENSLRYTTKGGVLIGCRRRAGKVRIEVADTGIGIDPEHQEAIFQEFFQVGNEARDRSQGLGLGLAIVRRLTALLGHRLLLQSRRGRGTRFVLELEAGELQDEHSDTPPRQIVEPVGGLILVIDDEEIVRQGMEALLGEWACEVVTAADGDSAAAWIRSHRRRPDLVIADYRLKEGRTGLQALKQVSAACNAEVPAVILTGDTAVDRISEVKRSGVRLLHKPVQPEALKAMVASAGRQ